MSSEKPRIGVAGLGIMGAGIAANFVAKGYPTAVWNRTAARAAPLVEQGAALAGSPLELARGSAFVVSSLSDPPAVLAFAHALLPGAHPALRWIETSTIGPDASLVAAELCRKAGVAYLEAPVTGSKVGARQGTLTVMTGGPAPLHELCAPIISQFATRVIHCGPVGAAAVVKLIGNSLISFMLEGLSETTVLAERAGISLEKVLEVVQASGFASPYWSFKGGAIQRRDFETHFSLDLLHKDQALALADAARRRVPMPGLAAIHQVTSAARALGFGGEDIAAQVKAVEAMAGGATTTAAERAR